MIISERDIICSTETRKVIYESYDELISYLKKKSNNPIHKIIIFSDSLDERREVILDHWYRWKCCYLYKGNDIYKVIDNKQFLIKTVIPPEIEIANMSKLYIPEGTIFKYGDFMSRNIYEVIDYASRFPVMSTITIYAYNPKASDIAPKDDDDHNGIENAKFRTIFINFELDSLMSERFYLKNPNRPSRYEYSIKYCD